MNLSAFHLGVFVNTKVTVPLYFWWRFWDM